MLEPGDDALGRCRRLPADAADAAAMHGDPIGNQRPGVGGGKLGAGGAHVAQPAEAVQRFLPAAIGDLHLKGGAAGEAPAIPGPGAGGAAPPATIPPATDPRETVSSAPGRSKKPPHWPPPA